MSATEQKLAEIARLESQFGPLDLGLADALEDFALWYADNRIYSGAEPYFRRSLAIREQILGADIAVADALERWAKCAVRKRQYDAQELFRKSLAIREGISGPMSLDLVPSFDALADWYLSEFFGLAKAVSCLRRSLEIIDSHGLVSAEVASRLLKLGELLLAGRPAEAEPLLRRALAIREELHGPENAEFAATLDALIKASIAINRHDHVGSLLARSLKLKATLLAHQPAELLQAFEAAVEPLANHGRLDDLASLLQSGSAATWPAQVRLLLRLAESFLQQGRNVDMDEAVRLGVETLQKILELGEDERLAPLWELWPGFTEDEFRQMSQTSDIGLDRLAHALGRIAVRYVGPPDPDDELLRIEDVDSSPDEEKSDDIA